MLATACRTPLRRYLLPPLPQPPPLLSLVCCPRTAALKCCWRHAVRAFRRHVGPGRSAAPTAAQVAESASGAGRSATQWQDGRHTGSGWSAGVAGWKEGGPSVAGQVAKPGRGARTCGAMPEHHPCGRIGIRIGPDRGGHRTCRTRLERGARRVSREKGGRWMRASGPEDWHMAAVTWRERRRKKRDRGWEEEDESILVHIFYKHTEERRSGISPKFMNL